ncbi:putative rRNA methyltransferase YqxC [Candidatus Desulfarcum epimagneticum]|uniref:Putative rRNA methyltransferase YqxC n=1 Tax=uncultured Desulfobacteraceae bacterium TaxID=218296 RepID=A0A484HGR3_9BACT|nr:putative rRNA methyltransferase YqxC [uncultured Desulfobacteraceae bacterium]
MKKRLDLLILEKGLAGTRRRAQSLIMAGKVRVNDRPADKPGASVDAGASIVVKEKDFPYVGRGGVKLEKALKHFKMDVSEAVCLDVGASTGGFTDCLLQNGASRVFAVDVGYGQLAWKLRQDPRVVVIERTNIRHMAPDALPSPADLAVIDVSFISLKIVVPAALKFLKDEGRIIALIKPQFEAGRKNVGKGGVVRDPAVHDQVIQDLLDFFKEKNLSCLPVTDSPILGPKGNKEFLALMKKPG